MADSSEDQPSGRLVIPAECRAAAGIKPGDELLIEAIGEGELRLRTGEQAIKTAQAIVARYPQGAIWLQSLLPTAAKRRVNDADGQRCFCSIAAFA